VMRAPADFTYVLPDKLSSKAAAPLLCAGVLTQVCTMQTVFDAACFQVQDRLSVSFAMSACVGGVRLGEGGGAAAVKA
jgi:D-arabinose 1-dehydrogenase-like Zn-dependent alcohol dehydrogenase